MDEIKKTRMVDDIQDYEKVNRQKIAPSADETPVSRTDLKPLYVLDG